MTTQNIGYTRVSSLGQNEERQLDGIQLDDTYTDKCSGSTRDRPALKDCLKHLRKGDTLHIHSIDRLARNLLDLQTIVNELVGRGVSVRFHKEKLEFTGDDNPMAKLTLQLMGSFAEFERSMIRSRQAEGIALAKKKGVKLGRKSALSDTQIAEIKAKASTGIAKSKLAEEYNVSRPSIYRAINA